MSFKYPVKKEIVAVDNTQPHEALMVCGERTLNPFLEKEIQRYGNVLRPIAVKDTISGIFMVVAYLFLVEKAKKDGVEEIEALVVDCPIGEAPRLCNYAVPFSQKKSYGETYTTSEYLYKYLSESPEGKQFCNDLPGKQKRDKVGFLLGYQSGSIITKILAIGRFAPGLLKNLDEDMPGLTLDDAYSIATAIKREIDEENATKAANAQPQQNGETPPNVVPIWTSNSTNQSPATEVTTTAHPKFLEPSVSEDLPDFEAIDSGGVVFQATTATQAFGFSNPTMSVKMEGVGNLDLDLTGHEVKAYINGVLMQGFWHRIIESGEMKTLQLFSKDDVAATITYNKSLFNQ